MSLHRWISVAFLLACSACPKVERVDTIIEFARSSGSGKFEIHFSQVTCPEGEVCSMTDVERLAEEMRRRYVAQGLKDLKVKIEKKNEGKTRDIRFTGTYKSLQQLVFFDEISVTFDEQREKSLKKEEISKDQIRVDNVISLALKKDSYLIQGEKGGTFTFQSKEKDAPILATWPHAELNAEERKAVWKYGYKDLPTFRVSIQGKNFESP